MSFAKDLDTEDMKSDEPVTSTTGYGCRQGCTCCQLVIQAMCTAYDDQKDKVLSTHIFYDVAIINNVYLNDINP